MPDDLYIGLGANLPHPVWGAPRRTLERALTMLKAVGLGIKAVSPFYESAPVPASDQPWYVNAVARIETELRPQELLDRLHEVERALGRKRGEKNESRAIDLDLLIYGDVVCREGPGPLLPHPRMRARAFVLLPLRDLAPNWRDPETGRNINELINDLPFDQQARRLAGA